MADINATLEQLTENAQALKSATTSSIFTHEVEALEKTQESLLARLMHRQSVLDMGQKKRALETIRKETIHNKIADYGKRQAKSIKRRRKKTST